MIIPCDKTCADLGIIAPMVHLGGTSRAELDRVYSEAIRALSEAIAATAETYPNGRDYYRLPGDAMARAIREHEARALKLRAVFEELSALQASVEEPL